MTEYQRIVLRITHYASHTPHVLALYSSIQNVQTVDVAHLRSIHEAGTQKAVPWLQRL